MYSWKKWLFAALSIIIAAALMSMEIIPSFGGLGPPRQVTTLDGTPLASIEQLLDAGTGFVVLSYWSIDCQDCAAQLNELEKLQGFADTFNEEMGLEGIMIFALNNGDSIKDINGYLKEASYKVLAGSTLPVRAEGQKPYTTVIGRTNSGWSGVPGLTWRGLVDHTTIWEGIMGYVQS